MQRRTDDVELTLFFQKELNSIKEKFDKHQRGLRTEFNIGSCINNSYVSKWNERLDLKDNIQNVIVCYHNCLADANYKLYALTAELIELRQFKKETTMRIGELYTSSIFM